MECPNCGNTEMCSIWLFYRCLSCGQLIDKTEDENSEFAKRVKEGKNERKICRGEVS